MSFRAFAFTSISLVALASLVACSDSEESSSPTTTATPDAGTPASDAGAADTGSPAADAAAPYVEPTSCELRNDTGGPGQYSDGCVKRAWVEPYAGTYTSSKCELSITATGSVAATFTMKVLSGELAGTYTTDFDGAPSPGNDSYYRFTTDATFATTKTLNYTSGQKVGTTDERALSLRVEGLDTAAAPVFKGRYSQVIGGVPKEFDCEALTRK